MSRRIRNLVTSVAVICICQFCVAQSITVAAAADLRFAMQDVAAQFQKKTGKAAVAAMQKEDIYDKVKDKFMLGENISQTASFVMSGSAHVGIVTLSLALSPNMKDKGRYFEVPAGDYPPIKQACVILSSSKNKETAKQFLSFIKTAEVADTLGMYGFDVQLSQR